jgi:long-chain acyl-CoA synthetase
VIPGYFKNEAETKVAIDSEGWLHSGDIACLLYPTRSLKIIDRRKNIFKLSQGEYVAPDRLENIFKIVPGVQDVYVYGDSYKSVLVAIAVIDEAAYKKFAVESAVIANADVSFVF